MEKKIPINSKIIKIIQQDNIFNLTWVINNFCNNSCSYCPPSLHNGKRKIYDSENIKNFLKIIIDKHKKIHCSITGGEPTLSPHFLDIIKIFNENNCTVGITTNGIRKIDFWEKNAHFLEYIVFSYHIESIHNKDFFEKINYCKNITDVSVRMMMLPSRWDECIDIYKKIAAIKGINYEPVRILNWSQDNKEYNAYTSYQEKWFDRKANIKKIKITRNSKNIRNFQNNIDFYFDNGDIINSSDISANDLINAKLTNFYNYECEIGLKSMFIFANGEIRLGNCGVGGIIGNLNDIDDIKWPSKSVICNKQVCHCTTDVYINKKINKKIDYNNNIIKNMKLLNFIN